MRIIGHIYSIWPAAHYFAGYMRSGAGFFKRIYDKRASPLTSRNITRDNAAVSYVLRVLRERLVLHILYNISFLSIFSNY